MLIVFEVYLMFKKYLQFTAEFILKNKTNYHDIFELCQMPFLKFTTNYGPLHHYAICLIIFTLILKVYLRGFYQ